MGNFLTLIFICLFLFYSCLDRHPLFNFLNTDTDTNSESLEKNNNSTYYWVYKVIEYMPAPGYYVNNSAFNDVEKIYGPPIGGGTFAPDNSSVITLGAGGGYIIVQFKPPIENHPNNINGYDFIIFGNAFWLNNNPDNSFKEPGIVEVMKDVNNNNLPDDEWYLINNSLSLCSNIILKYHKYDLSYKPDNKSWYPVLEGYPELEVLFSFFLVPSEYTGTSGVNIWGFADCTPTLKLGDMSGAIGDPSENSLTDSEDKPDIAPEDFYTVPTDVNYRGIESGSGGGDAFKIEWAVNETNFQPVYLDRIDFIKITSAGTNILNGYEVSTEIDAIARVKKRY